MTNGGFETGGLQGWQETGVPPTVESSVAYNGAFAARFETPPNGPALTQCTLHAQQCALLNSSSISEDVSSLTISSNTTLSIALYPSFQSPSIFQVTLSFTLPSQRTPAATLYYVAASSADQCNAYRALLTNATQNSSAFCLDVLQGKWNLLTRNLSNDIPSPPGDSKLAGSTLTISLSFAGGNSTDYAYADSVRLS